jgi:hypothetical protein
MRSFVAVLAMACFGCSFAFVTGPPSEPSSEPHEPSRPCTTSVLYPVLDSVAAAVGAVNIGIAANASPGKVSWYGIEMESKTGVALGVTQLALFGAGAVYGFVQTSRCNAYREKVRTEPEGSSWSPALASEAREPPAEATVPPEPGARPPTPSTSPLPPGGAPAGPATPAASASPAATSSSPTPPGSRVPTVAFPD